MGHTVYLDLKSEEVCMILSQRKGSYPYFSLILNLASYQNCLC